MQLCFTCGKRPRRTWRDSMCRECRNAYVALWKAKKRHGEDLDGYAPRGPREQKPVRKVRGTPTEAERKRYGL